MSEPDEYVKFEMKVQRGDGPDRRGDVRVELQREIDDVDRTEKLMVSRPDGEDVRVETNPHHSAFGEFVYETERAVDLLCNRLGLDDDGANE